MRRFTRAGQPAGGGSKYEPKPPKREPTTVEEAQAYIAEMMPVMAHETIHSSMDRIRVLANSMLIIAKDDQKKKAEP